VLVLVVLVSVLVLVLVLVLVQGLQAMPLCQEMQESQKQLKNHYYNKSTSCTNLPLFTGI
jgi:Tfp pilus assembly protein PilO